MQESEESRELDSGEASAEETPRQAAALGYRPERERAPRVLASGRGTAAETIIEIAREHGVPLHSDPELAALLGELDVGEEIPEALFHAVAEVLAYIFSVTASNGTTD